jgi:CHAT domain-containing protein/tetratricopeptide (TPR) repeat protein
VTFIAKRIVLLAIAAGLAGAMRSESVCGAAALDAVSASRLAWAERAGSRADSLDRAGSGSQAIVLIERQLAIRERRLGPLHPKTLASISALARVAFAEGQTTRAHDLNRVALARRRAALAPDHPDVAESLAQLATGLKNSGAWREALRLHTEALAIRRRTFGPDAIEVAESLMGLGNVHRVMFHPDSALAAFGEALAIRRRALGPRHPEVAATLTDMAIVETQGGHWARAEPGLREAVDILDHAEGRTRDLELATSMLGVTLRHLGQFAAAEAQLERSVALREASRARVTAGTGRAAMFDLRGYSHLAAAQLENGRQEAAWISIERGLGRTLIETTSARGLIDTSRLWRAPLARVQRGLPEDAALIGWLELQRGAGSEEWPFWCYCIRREGPVRWHRVDARRGGASASRLGEARRMPEASPTSDLVALRNDLRAAAAWPLRASDDSDARRLGRDVYGLRIAPLERDLAGVRELIVVSPDVDHGLPIEALVDARGRSMSERFAISYAPSALWRTLRGERARPRRDPWSALLVGDPAYGPNASGGAWPRLVASDAEIHAIAPSFPGARVLLGPLACERELRRLAGSGALEDYRIIHLSTHAAIDERWPGRSALVLAESGLENAMTSPATASADGRLSADEIAGWRLGADLVSLASCRSALGPPTHVDGYLGLDHALLAAGARCLLVSLWRIEDRATALMMRAFYRDVAGQLGRSARTGAPSLAAALRHAQEAVRNWQSPDGGHPYRHPAYWAGVVLLGDAP